jgi:uncharacterized DUF497 family protein
LRDLDALRVWKQNVSEGHAGSGLVFVFLAILDGGAPHSNCHRGCRQSISLHDPRRTGKDDFGFRGPGDITTDVWYILWYVSCDSIELNLRKHAVSFDEAQEAFFDPNALEEYDEEHSTAKEQRFKLLGLSNQRLLVVVFAEIENETIRIISTRKAGPQQRKAYEQG